MSELTRGLRLQIMLMKEELRALDDWRFQRRMPSRAAAVRELLKRGLSAEGFEIAEPGKKSQDFGMTRQHNGEGVAASLAKPESGTRRGQRQT